MVIYRLISAEKPANEPDESTIEPENGARFQRRNPRIRRSNPRSCERPWADRMPHPFSFPVCFSTCCRTIICADLNQSPNRAANCWRPNDDLPNDPDPGSTPRPGPTAAPRLTGLSI